MPTTRCLVAVVAHPRCVRRARAGGQPAEPAHAGQDVGPGGEPAAPRGGPAADVRGRVHGGGQAVRGGHRAGPGALHGALRARNGPHGDEGVRSGGDRVRGRAPGVRGARREEQAGALPDAGRARGADPRAPGRDPEPCEPWHGRGRAERWSAELRRARAGIGGRGAGVAAPGAAALAGQRVLPDAAVSPTPSASTAPPSRPSPSWARRGATWP